MVCDGPGDFRDARARWLMMGEVVKTQATELGVTAGAVVGPLATVHFSTAPAQAESYVVPCVLTRDTRTCQKKMGALCKLDRAARDTLLGEKAWSGILLWLMSVQASIARLANYKNRRIFLRGLELQFYPFIWFICI